MAGAGYKLFNTGDVLTAAQVNTYLQEQVVMVFNDATARTTALSGVLAEGMLSYLKDTDAVQYYNGSSWTTINTDQTPLTTKGDLFTYSTADARLGVGSAGQVLTADSAETTGLKWNAPVASLANPIINGGFDIWQRGTSSTNAATTVTYCADRWSYYTNATAANYTISRQSVSDATNLPNLQYAMRVQRDSGKTTTSLLQMSTSIETANSIPFAGKSVTLSFYARCGANFSSSTSIISVILDQGTGTDQNTLNGFTGGSNVGSVNATLTTTWQRFVVTGTVSTSAKELAVSHYYTPTGTAGANDWYEITGLQIDVGTYTASTAPTFRRSGGTLAGELMAAQRYYYRNSGGAYALQGFGFADGTTTIAFDVTTPVSLRSITPVVSYSNLEIVLYGTAVYAFTALNLQTGGGGSNRFALSATGATGLTQNRPYAVRNANSTSGFLALEAEL